MIKGPKGYIQYKYKKSNTGILWTASTWLVSQPSAVHGSIAAFGRKVANETTQTRTPTVSQNYSIEYGKLQI